MLLPQLSYIYWLIHFKKCIFGKIIYSRRIFVLQFSLLLIISNKVTRSLNSHCPLTTNPFIHLSFTYQFKEITLVCGTLYCFNVFTRLLLADWYFLLLLILDIKMNLQLIFYKPAFCIDFNWLMDSLSPIVVKLLVFIISCPLKSPIGIILLIFLCVNEKYIAEFINISNTEKKETTELLHTFNYFDNEVSYAMLVITKLCL